MIEKLQKVIWHLSAALIRAKKKSTMNIQLLAIVVCLYPLVSQADPVELTVKLDVLKAMTTGTTTFLLPEFEVFKANGIGIYHHISLPKNFKSILKSAIRSQKENESLLKDRLSMVTLYNGKEFDSSQLDKVDFVFLEYWAEWCIPCKLQMKQVKEFIAENPKTKVLWLKVEKDPTKAGEEKMQAKNIL